MIWWVIVIFVVILLISLKVVYQYEKGVKFTLGKFTGIMNPGLRIVIPIIQKWERVDMRTLVIDVPQQDSITKDNVSVNINAVIYFRVKDSERAVIKVEDYFYAISQLAQTTMRDVVGEFPLDQVLSNRDEISKKIKVSVDKATDPWGIEVHMVELKDVLLPSGMTRTMARQAEAARERRAVILKAEGEAAAAQNLATAADMMRKTPGALHLRTLQSLNDVSSDSTNTVHFAVPLELLDAYEGGSGK
ncbi:MAG: slipin family protein [Candidatus Nanoarchaeia archaeon]